MLKTMKLCKPCKPYNLSCWISFTAGEQSEKELKGMAPNNILNAFFVKMPI
jgi:hypothetical protein